MAKEPVLVALDTNFILDLADGLRECTDCIFALKSVCTPKFILTPTAFSELGHLQSHGETSLSRRLAKRALEQLINWKIKPVSLPGVPNGIVEVIGAELRAKGLIPHEERHDSLVVAEAAYLECNLLLSSDRHLTDIPRKALHALLKSKDVRCVDIAYPELIIQRFGSSRKRPK